MSRYKTAKRPHPDIGLFMECEDEELSAAQKIFYGKIKKDHQKFNKKMDEYLQKMKGEVIVEEGDCFMFQIRHNLENVAANSPSGNVINIENQSIILSNTISSRAPRFTATPPAPVVKSPSTRGRRGRPPVVSRKPTTSPLVELPTAPPIRAKPNDKPSEANSLGGLVVSSRRTIPVAAPGTCDSEEVVIGKLPGKSYPSLTIVVKPYIFQNPMLMHQSATERSNLDVQVKGVLMYTASKFTEWLIQQGLIRSEQTCSIHQTGRKLGMFNDVSKFPYSGGYVWISDCCPSDFMSVYYGSILEGSPNVPNVVLKLIYHWSCQTNVQNVIQWVKVDSHYIKHFFMLLRAVCILAVHEKYGLLGGRGKKVQVGIISLGSNLDAPRSLSRVDVLGVMDMETQRVRLKAIDPISAKQRRTGGALDVLPSWVDWRSVVCVDYSTTSSYVRSLGFENVEQSNDSTKDILDYLRKAVPKLFQNTLHLLSKQLVQQFLDELVWRERWGQIAGHAFNNMVKHLADYTLHSREQGVLKRLLMTAENPFGLTPIVQVAPALERVIEVADDPPKQTVARRGQKRPVESDVIPLTPAKKTNVTPLPPAAVSAPAPTPTTSVQEKQPADIYWKVQPLDNGVTAEIINFFNTNSKISVESFYYGRLEGDDSKIIDRKPADQIPVKCCICLKQFMDTFMMLKHVLLHCQTKPQISGPLRKVHQCQLCFVGYPTLSALRFHLNHVHSPTPAMKDVICFICDKLFADRSQFVYHMHRTHVPLEMPYACQVCSYRSSLYSAFMEHITQVHRGGHHLFCPYCLKAVGLFRNNVHVPGNVVFFVNHVQRHLRHADIRCHRCRLSFVNKLLLQQHLEKDHSSYRYNPRVRSFQSICNTLMPAPGNLIKTALLPRIGKLTRLPGQYSVREFPVPIKTLAPSSYSCAECEGSIASAGHFSGELKCSKCRFQSCCELAVAEHYAIYHDVRAAAAFSPGKPVMDAPTMYCPCSFFSSSPNTLAKHLVQCENMTAYPTEAAARIARERASAVEEAEHTVLNVLGLMRNPSEPMMVKTQEVGELDPPADRISQPKVILSKLAIEDNICSDQNEETATKSIRIEQENASEINATMSSDSASDQPQPLDGNNYSSIKGHTQESIASVNEGDNTEVPGTGSQDQTEGDKRSEKDNLSEVIMDDQLPSPTGSITAALQETMSEGHHENEQNLTASMTEGESGGASQEEVTHTHRLDTDSDVTDLVAPQKPVIDDLHENSNGLPEAINSNLTESDDQEPKSEAFFESKNADDLTENREESVAEKQQPDVEALSGSKYADNLAEPQGESVAEDQQPDSEAFSESEVSDNLAAFHESQDLRELGQVAAADCQQKKLEEDSTDSIDNEENTLTSTKEQDAEEMEVDSELHADEDFQKEAFTGECQQNEASGVPDRSAEHKNVSQENVMENYDENSETRDGKYSDQETNSGESIIDRTQVLPASAQSQSPEEPVSGFKDGISADKTVAVEDIYAEDSCRAESAMQDEKPEASDASLGLIPDVKAPSSSASNNIGTYRITSPDTGIVVASIPMDSEEADSKEEEATGRLIEELENMMETEDIPPSVVTEPPDFMTDLI